MHVVAQYTPCGPLRDDIGLLSAAWESDESGIWLRHTKRFAVYRQQLSPRQYAALVDVPDVVVLVMHWAMQSWAQSMVRDT